MNILLIDDDKNFLFLLSQVLRKQGYRVFSALNGIRALHLLHSHKVDLILSDVLMEDTPIMSLTCTLKASYPQTPLILLSGLTSGPLITNALNLGADEFLAKPVDLPLLYSTIEKLGHEHKG